MSDFSLSGLASGFDWKPMVEQLIEIERIPQQRLRNEQADNEDKASALGEVKSNLDSLKNASKTLSDEGIFGARSVSLSGSGTNLGSFLNSTAAANTLTGKIEIKHVSLSSQTMLTGVAAGAVGVGKALVSTDNLNGLNLVVPVSEGTFSVGSKQYKIGTGGDFTLAGSTLDAVLAQITTDIADIDNAYYDTTQGRVVFRGDTNPIIMGRPSDTSNFLDTLKMFSQMTLNYASEVAEQESVTLTTPADYNSQEDILTITAANVSSVKTGDVISVDVNGTTVTTKAGTDFALNATLATLQQNIRDSLLTKINASAAGGTTTATNGAAVNQILIKADLSATTFNTNNFGINETARPTKVTGATTTANVAAVSQVDTLTINAGTIGALDTFSIDVDINGGGVNTVTVTEGSEINVGDTSDQVATALAAKVSLLAGVTAAGIGGGQLTITADTAGNPNVVNNAVTTAGGGASNGTATTTANVVAVTQVETLSSVVSNSLDIAAGDTFSVDVNGTTITSAAMAGGETPDQVATAIAAAINASGAVNAQVTAAALGGASGQLTVTSDAAGTAITTANYVLIDQGTVTSGVATDLDPSVTAGDAFSLTVDGTAYSYNVAVGNKTSTSIAAGLAAAIGGAATATNAANVITMTAATLGEAGAFAVAGQTAPAVGSAVSASTLVTSAANEGFIYDEAGFTATNNYAANDFLMIGGTRYKVLSTLSSGDTLTNGVNIQSLTNVGAGDSYGAASDVVFGKGGLGSIIPGTGLENIKFQNAITTGAHNLTINDVTVAYDTSKDSLSDVIDRVNASAANVTMVYDSLQDQVLIVNDESGALGVDVADTTGNLLATLGLTTGTKAYGNDARMTLSINGAPDVTVQSNTNTFDATSHGVTGLDINVKKAFATTDNAITISVDADVGVAGSKIQDFVNQYNAVANLLENLTETTISGSSVETAILSDNLEITRLSSELRKIVFGDPVGHAKSNLYNSGLERITDIGLDFSSEGRLLLKDKAALDEALTKNSNLVQALFTQEITEDVDSGFERDGVTARNNGTKTYGGVAQYVQGFIELFNDGTTFVTTYPGAASASGKGTIEVQTDNLTARNARIDIQIAALERLVESEEERLTNSFIRMEEAQSSISQQMTALQGSLK